MDMKQPAMHDLDDLMFSISFSATMRLFNGSLLSGVNERMLVLRDRGW